MNQQEKKALSITACKVRMGVIEGTYHAKSGHPGGSLSFADIFTWFILFFIIGCEFFITYRLQFRKKAEKEEQ